MGYDHKKIEKKWQKTWEREKLYQVKNSVAGKKNFYLLVELPYPSGNLHVGHWYAFAVPDILARVLRMQGRNVLYPIGFDAFGLPAENAAIQRGINPRIWTEKNIAYMTEQIRSMGTSFDWTHTASTIDPEYYRWTQWQFLQFFKKDLAYRKDTLANWCPSCKTVLANEQVIEGKCERCKSAVEQRKLPQWNMRITRYADRLHDDLETLDWPSAIKDAQRSWIGRSQGAHISFSIAGDDQKKIEVFTTRPDTLFGATYLVLAPEHDILPQLSFTNREEVLAYVEKTKHKTQLEREERKEKSGVKLFGVSAVNPATGDMIPVFIADYVLGGYGTGAIMGVPAHDTRDGEFAAGMQLPIKRVIDERGILIDSGTYSGLSAEETRATMARDFGTPTTNYRLRDWIVSRQRYWGVPIPIIHCTTCGEVPVPEKDLPVLLPKVTDYLPDGSGRSPLAKATRWVKIRCPKCSAWAQRETDTLDTFVDSSWYFLRYLDPKNKKSLADKKKLRAWMPIDLYSGGAEHTTLHLLYSRFWHKMLYDLHLVGESEPYVRRMNRSLIMGPDGQKMSKSRGNVIDPDEVVVRLGADTVRMYLAFMGPYGEVANYPWNPDGVVGIRRFLDRVWRLGEKDFLPTGIQETAIHKTIRKVEEDSKALKFNTAISALMVFLNAAEKTGVSKKEWEAFLKLLAPFAPHLAEDLWRNMGKKKSIHLEKWPRYDARCIIEEIMSIAVQVGGKTRAVVELPSASDEQIVIDAAKKALGERLSGGIVRTVYVPKRLVNFVTS
jgi:leucyl-tRNA synthetase